jgi:U6 snRNA-associated Sm-like protein LSm5
MTNDKEVVGTLLGSDDFVNMLLEDVTKYESTPEGRKITNLHQILLNGNNITMVCTNKTICCFLFGSFTLLFN